MTVDDLPGSDPLGRIPWPLRTPRTTLRRIRADDLPALFGYRSRRDVAEWLVRQETELTLFADRMAALMGVWLVVEHEGSVIGDVYCRIEDGWGQAGVTTAVGTHSQAELGWALHPDHTGRGLMSEALSALLDHLVDGGLVRRVYACAFADNHASIRLMERLGMRREARHVRESWHRDRGWVDGVVHAVGQVPGRGVRDESFVGRVGQAVRACSSGSVTSSTWIVSTA